MPAWANSIRRRLLQGFVAFGFGFTRLGRGDEPDAAAASAPPETDDLLVFAFGEREGRTIAPDDIVVGVPQVFAFAKDPKSGIVRNGTRLYQIVLVRLDPARLSEQTAERSVEGVVAYSGVCTHTGCDVTDWNADLGVFQCPCHESQFDPRDSAHIVGGPAPWPLAALPLKLIKGRLAVARPFEGRIGFQQPGLDPFGL
jgi:rieske iron-sulfur protein